MQNPVGSQSTWASEIEHRRPVAKKGSRGTMGTDVCQIQYTTWEEGLEEAIRILICEVGREGLRWFDSKNIMYSL